MRFGCSVVASALLALLCGGETRLHAEADAPAGRQITTAAMELDAQARRLYAVDAERNQLLVLNLTTGQQSTVPVGRRPIAVALDRAAQRAYTVNAGSGSVSVVDLKTNRIVATVPTDTHPYAIAVDPRLHRVYVSNVFSDTLTVIDGRTNTATAQKAGSQDALLVEPLAGRVWLCSYESERLHLLDERSAAVRPVNSVNHVWAIAPDPVGKGIFAVSIGSDQLVRIGPHDEMTKVKVGSMPDALVVDGGLGRIDVANYASGTVTVLDAATLRVLATVPVGKTPQALALDEARHRLYVANTHDKTLSVLDTRSNRVTATLPAGNFPYQVVLDPESGDVFVATFEASAYRRIATGAERTR